MNVQGEDLNNQLPHIVLFPKFHKPKLSQRFVVSYVSCVIKPLASRITLALKAVYQQVISYSNMIYKATGIRRNWIINDNTPILDCIENIGVESRARNIETYDFTTLYTNLQHQEIREALSSVLRLCFRHSKRKYISIYASSSAWVNSVRGNTFYFDINSLIEAIDFLLDNCYFTLGSYIFRQLIGVPIGVSPGPYIANLVLFYYENKFIECLYKKDYVTAKRLNYTFRLIDDISSINSDGLFQQVYTDIYPASLTLNKENVGDQQANVLDLNINIEGGRFEVKLFDKRDDFPFSIVQFNPNNSNMSYSTSYGVFGSQIIRYFRICNGFESFMEYVCKLVTIFIGLGYNRAILKTKFSRMYERHKFCEKFPESVTLLDTLFR